MSSMSLVVSDGSVIIVGGDESLILFATDDEKVAKESDNTSDVLENILILIERVRSFVIEANWLMKE
jgi:hypothetical protein